MPKENTKKCIFAAKNTANMHFFCIKHNQFVLLFMVMGLDYYTPARALEKLQFSREFIQAEAPLRNLETP